MKPLDQPGVLMVAPPRPVPTTSTAAAGELIVPTARRHRVAGATDSPHAHSVRVAAADLAVLDQAAHALAHPTEELAAALGRANLAHRDALTQLLVVLDPPTDRAIRLDDRPVIPSPLGR